MAMNTLILNKLIDHINQLSPSWLDRQSNLSKIQSLSSLEINALNRLFAFELKGEGRFRDGNNMPFEYSMFGYELNELAAEILCAAAQPIICGAEKFLIDESNYDGLLLDLKKNGYFVLNECLSNLQVGTILNALKTQKFQERCSSAPLYSGSEILNFVTADANPPVGQGGTFWAIDQNNLVQDPRLSEIAFNPFILSVVSRYFGCTPIHVQTNAWFSFPSRENNSHLSENAQQFHQDKEFIKFIKVFIYLSDVDIDNGAHSYIEGSHVDDLYSKGVGFSDRVDDDSIGAYYDKSRIKVVPGKSGTLIFGDTACAHRGYPVLNGHRAILQIEYASSLFMSGTRPFENLPSALREPLPYCGEQVDRLTSNYNTEARYAFDEVWNKSYRLNDAPSPGIKSLLKQLAMSISKKVKS
jgi:hypothetical protein